MVHAAIVSVAVALQVGNKRKSPELPEGRQTLSGSESELLMSLEIMAPISLSCSKASAVVLSALCQSALCRALRPEIPRSCFALCNTAQRKRNKHCCRKHALKIVQICFWELLDTQALSWKYGLAEVTPQRCSFTFTTLTNILLACPLLGRMYEQSALCALQQHAQRGSDKANVTDHVNQWRNEGVWMLALAIQNREHILLLISIVLCYLTLGLS